MFPKTIYVVGALRAVESFELFGEPQVKLGTQCLCTTAREVAKNHYLTFEDDTGGEFSSLKAVAVEEVPLMDLLNEMGCLEAEGPQEGRMLYAIAFTAYREEPNGELEWKLILDLVYFNSKKEVNLYDFAQTSAYFPSKAGWKSPIFQAFTVAKEMLREYVDEMCLVLDDAFQSDVLTFKQ